MQDQICGTINFETFADVGLNEMKQRVVLKMRYIFWESCRKVIYAYYSGPVPYQSVA